MTPKYMKKCLTTLVMSEKCKVKPERTLFFLSDWHISKHPITYCVGEVVGNRQVSW